MIIPTTKGNFMYIPDPHTSHKNAKTQQATEAAGGGLDWNELPTVGKVGAVLLVLLLVVAVAVVIWWLVDLIMDCLPDDRGKNE